MKFTALINIAGIADAGFAECTDFDDWVILEYVMNWQVNSQAMMSNNHVWINYAHLLKEIPLLRFKSKNRLSERVAKLKKLGLLSTFLDDDSKLFAKVTDIYNEVVNFRGTPRVSRDVDPVRSAEHPVRSAEHPVRSAEHPVRSAEHILNNQLLNNQDQTTTTTREDEFEMNIDWQPTERELKISLFRAGGFDIKKIDPAWLVEFVLYWSSENRKHNQAKWTAKFAMKCISYFRNPQLFNSQQGIRASPDLDKTAIHPPQQDNELIPWMKANDLGEGPPGLSYEQLRAWARRAMRIKDNAT